MLRLTLLRSPGAARCCQAKMADTIDDDDFQDVKPNFGYWFDVEQAMKQVTGHEEKTGTRYGFLRADPNFGAACECYLQFVLGIDTKKPYIFTPVLKFRT